jgi:hypothetical protein
MSSSSVFQQRSGIERGGIINNAKRQKPEATKKHFANFFFFFYSHEEKSKIGSSPISNL